MHSNKMGLLLCSAWYKSMHQSALPRHISSCSLLHSCNRKSSHRLHIARRGTEPKWTRQRLVQRCAAAPPHSSEHAARAREVEHVDVQARAFRHHSAMLLPSEAVVKSLRGCLCLQDGKFTVTGCLRTPVPQESVWQVLTDYEGLARTYSTVLESHSRLVDKQRQVLQAGSARTCVGTCACQSSCVPKGSLHASLQGSCVLGLT